MEGGEVIGEEQDNPVVSLHALHEVEMHSTNRTMKLVGIYKKKNLNILVDSGSTHNFLDAQVAKRVRCTLQIINGCANHVDVLIMPIKGCQLILGMEWLKSFRIVKRDFQKMKMEFS